ncbi:his Kinase A domain protein [Parabacteroides distasonis str. 3776 D15 iv]|uniref:histidine kinase n=1 Tax=Parabacteroides distasonis str. 3776 D15 i TaxID=1339342 RepID=A0AB34LEV2_PARDI|nr:MULTISPECIES: ATP-binding protein [Bacteroidales]KDS37958.1 his Kinase A domain protein [Parabacteroides distasonis str. 3776 D15 i]KDS73968.1 his Kinase A domain protein [Parabacteroides distasonis str. 3776 D15 iv]UVR24264.1 ATP-binding protein [Parabacteroides distasonis]WMI44643.1 ATP-binding protein [Parabacteroides distasonis]
MDFVHKVIISSHTIIILLVVGIAYTWYIEWHEVEILEAENKQIDELKKEINDVHIKLIEFSLLGETILEWDDEELEHYHTKRMAMDSMLCRLKAIYPAERIDSVRHLLKDKEQPIRGIVKLLDEQQALNEKIVRQLPVIVQKSVQEQPKKPKRKGFWGIFGKKEEAKPTVTTTMLRSFNRNIIAEQQTQSRRLSEHADSLAARNAELNRQLQGLIIQIDGKVQADLQKRELEIAAMRERSFLQIGSLTGFLFLILVVSYIIIHRNANCIKRYRRKTSDLIGELQKSVEQNEVLIASRKKAVHTITHELRTPLTAIIGYTALMEKGNDADKKEQYVRNIRQSSERMCEMLNTLLSFFRLDNGKEQLVISACRISAITHIFETEFMPIAMNKGLALTVTNRTDEIVVTDKERILQIGNNLLSNAIKFTDSGGVSLTTDYDNGILKLIIEDTGTGMTEEEQQRVFGAFERLANAAAKDGFGLGLSIVQRIVSMLGGTIQLESEKGKGSCFTVGIPMQTAGELPERINQTRIHHDRTFHDVIAIDNDEVLLLMLKEMYAQEGIHCDTCTNAAELMEMIRRKEYSLLLTDLNMPEINGFELLELLRTSNVGNSKTIPVVVTTASGSCSKEELMERGFSGCLLKPFSISELMEVSDKCAMKGNRNEKPDFTSLLSYGNESVMLEKLIAETEKEMQAIREAGLKKDLQELDALTHHLRSSWEILRADQPLRELYKLLHSDGTPDDKTIGNAVKAVLDKGSEIIRLAKEERRKYENG